MANTKSAIKRIKINRRNNLQNKQYKGIIKGNIKIFFKSIRVYQLSKTIINKQKIEKVLTKTYSAIDKAVQKHIIHKNKAARKKSQLANYFLKV